MVLAPAALLVVLVPAGGSAKPPPVTNFEICVQNATSGTATPACSAVGTASSFAGNTVATVKVTVKNDAGSNLSIGSANVNVPPQLKVVGGSATPTSNVQAVGQTLRFRNLNLNKGQSFVATLQVDVACGGPGGNGDWSSQTQQAYTSSDGNTGTSFSYLNGSSAGVPSTISAACHLGFVHQPTDTTSGDTIVNRLPNEDPAITVGLFDNGGTAMTSCPVGYDTCSVDVDSLPGGVTGTTTEQLTGTGLVASFGDLSITNPALATQYNLTAVGDGSFAPQVTSGSFLIASVVNPITCSGGHCSKNQQQLSGPNLADSFADVTAVSNFNFMTLSPFTQTTPPLGCTAIASLGVTGFAESDNRAPGSGPMTIRYYVNKDVLTARYGKNVGNQFTPICVGGRPVDVATGTIEDCTQFDAVGGSSHGWQGDALNPKTGLFTGKEANAVCNSDGYYWGVISSYQDKLDQTTNPVVTNWGGANIGGDNYRFFDMSVPPNWDWRAGPA
jgi:hypothetical protein